MKAHRAIYQEGEIYAQTLTVMVDGIEYAAWTEKPDKSGNYTAEEYVAILNFNRKPSEGIFNLISLQELEKLQTAAQDSKYLKPWEEITEERYDEMLNILPPQKWQTVNGVNIFRMSEYMTDNITQHFARRGGKFFSGYFRTTTSYEELAEQVKKLI